MKRRIIWDMFAEEETTYSTKIKRLKPELEYFVRNSEEQGKDLLLFFPAFIGQYSYNAFRQSVISLQKLLFAMPEKVRKDVFWLNAQTTFSQNREVFEFLGQKNNTFSHMLRMQAVQEIKNTPDRRALAFCAGHDVDGYVLGAKCELAGINPKNVAVIVFDAHEDSSNTNGKAGAVRAMLEDHHFGHVTVIGLPKDHVEAINADSAQILEEIYAEFQSYADFEPKCKILKSLPKNRFIEIVAMLAEHHSDEDMINQLARTKEIRQILEILHESPYMDAKFISLLNNRNISRLNAAEHRLSYFSDSVTIAEIEKEFLLLKEQGITHIFWSIDIDVFDTMALKITVPEYTNWWLYAVMGLAGISKLIVNAKLPERWKIITKLFFEGAGKAITVNDSEPVPMHTNLVCRLGGLMPAQFRSYVAGIAELSVKYGIKLGVHPKGARGYFFGTITELHPDSPDYNGNTLKLVTWIAQLLHMFSDLANMKKLDEVA